MCSLMKPSDSQSALCIGKYAARLLSSQNRVQAIDSDYMTQVSKLHEHGNFDDRSRHVYTVLGSRLWDRVRNVRTTRGAHTVERVWCTGKYPRKN